MISLLLILIGTVIVVAIVLAAFLIIDMYQRLDDRGYIDQWLDRKFGKNKKCDINEIICKLQDEYENELAEFNFSGSYYSNGVMDGLKCALLIVKESG